MQDYEVFQVPPESFDTRLQGAGCYCEWKGKLLFLKRHPKKEDGCVWSIPGGKAEEGETPLQTVAREVFEEVGISLSLPSFKEVGVFYIRLPRLDYVFHTFCARFEKEPLINLGLDEHTEFMWCYPEEALKLPLLRGAQELLMHYRSCQL